MNPVDLITSEPSDYLRYLASLVPVSDRLDGQRRIMQLAPGQPGRLVEAIAARLAVARWERQVLDLRCGWNGRLFNATMNRRARTYYLFFLERLLNLAREGKLFQQPLNQLEQTWLQQDVDVHLTVEVDPLREAKQFDTDVTSRYRCPRCGCTRKTADSRHTGGADEGSTYLLTCVDCGHQTKMR